ncbi:energy transducer TonB [Barnesiella intestinihominis]|uniref:energy transducer TonB n=3 Tax=Barnesiella intestinihominis TaxID=487174 RepID=UPI003967B9C2
MRKIISFIFITWFISCSGSRDIVLTDFTKELISIYLNDSEHIQAQKRKDEIILISTTDSLYYTLLIFSNNSKSYKYETFDFVGRTIYMGHSIKAFGDKIPIFYSGNNFVKQKRQDIPNMKEYDPSVWQVSFYKDSSFCKMRTYKTTPSENIADIENLAKKYFKISRPSTNEIYQLYEVETEPQFILGNDSLRQIITSNFKRVKRAPMQGKIPVVVDVLIDKHGIAKLIGIRKSSGDTVIDEEALKVAKIICQYKFIPATHRGETVETIFPIMFLDNDVKAK